MIRVCRSIALAAPADKAWQMLRAFGELQTWHPSVETCRVAGGPQCRVGATRHVSTRDGLCMEEELAASSESGRRIEILTRTAPFPVSLMWQGLTVFAVTADDSAILRWEFRANGNPEWADRLRDWFGAGYIPAGLHGLAGYLDASSHQTIN